MPSMPLSCVASRAGMLWKAIRPPRRRARKHSRAVTASTGVTSATEVTVSAPKSPVRQAGNMTQGSPKRIA